MDNSGGYCRCFACRCFGELQYEKGKREIKVSEHEEIASALKVEK